MIILKTKEYEKWIARLKDKEAILVFVVVSGNVCQS